MELRGTTICAVARNGRIVQQEALGNLVAPDLRPLPSRAPAMVLHLEPGARHELLLRVRGGGGEQASQ